MTTDQRSQFTRPEVQYIYNTCFDDPGLEDSILAPMPDLVKYQAKKAKIVIPSDTAIELAPAYLYPILDRNQEAHLFRQMNFLKHKANIISRQTPMREHARRYDTYCAQAEELRHHLIYANYRLLISIVKKLSIPGADFFESLAEATLTLMNAVVKFDYSFGNKFSTYASWAILKWGYRFRLPPRLVSYTNIDDTYFEENYGVEEPDYAELEEVRLAKKRLQNCFEVLEERERTIVRLRNGLGSLSPTGAEIWTLEQIGAKLGITKERVRQLQYKAYNKMRQVEGNTTPYKPPSRSKAHQRRTKRKVKIVA